MQPTRKKPRAADAGLLAERMMSEAHGGIATQNVLVH
jgi:hypothetical protein